MTPNSPQTKVSGSPFRHKSFAVIWTATLASNIGWWMYSAACGWLMVQLNPAPLIVSLVQVANTLPMFLFAIPAGTLTDIVDKRKLLIAGEIAIAVVATAFAVLVWRHLITPLSLLAFTFLVAAGDALTSPAYQAIVPMLVPRSDVQKAVMANSAGINVSRAVGPALGGVLLGAFGAAVPFWINAVSNYGSIGALLWWREPERGSARIPAEHLLSAIGTGLRYARYNSPLGATLIRSAGFLLFASAFWALLPLVVRNQIGEGPTLYGILLGAIGASAVAGAFVLPRLSDWLGPDKVAAAGTLGTTLATAMFGLAHDDFTALVASLLAGISWISMISVLNISAQTSLPEWVRGRGLAIYLTVMFGALSLGSAIWGQVAASFGVEPALLAAAVGCAISMPLLWRWKLEIATAIDLSPALNWPVPVLRGDFDSDSGPVLVLVSYEIDTKNRDQFLTAMELVGRERRRDGAYDWRVFEDPTKTGRFVETFLSETWLDHLRQHERVTKTDRAREEAVRKFQMGKGPVTTHLIAVYPRRRH